MLLTAYVVNTLSDTVAIDGHVSLREAITAAVSGATSGDALAGTASNTIVFDSALTTSPATIDLTTALPDLTGTLSIAGPGSDRLTINRNSATAFRIFNASANATISIQGLKLTNGSSTSGGAILNQGTMTLSGVWLANNSVTGSGTASGGGGISNIAGVLSITASTLSANSASGVGGGAIDNANGTLSITNTTIYGNATSAVGAGGALRMQGNSAVTVLSSTIYNNSANALRGGISINGGTLSIGNSIVAGNLPLTGNDLQIISGAVSSLGFNYIGASGNLTNGANHDQVGTTAARLVPSLGPLASLTPGAVPTLAPQNGSSGTLLDAGSAVGLAFDANGQSRVFDDLAVSNAAGSDGTDIGAVEMGPRIAITDNAAPVTNGSASPATTNGTDFGSVVQNGGSVTQTFTVTNTGQRTLTLGAVSVPAGYATNRTSSWSVAPGSTGTFTVSFTDTTVGGAHAGTVSLSTNDGLANPFSFAVNTTVLGPKLTVLSSGATSADGIANNEFAPAWADGSYFGSLRVGSGPASRTFTLKNDGTAPLNLFEVDLTGDPEFSIPVPVDPVTLNPGQSIQFTVNMAARSATGNSNATLDVIHDDPNNPVFEFAIGGRTGEPILVSGNGNAILDNATSPLVSNATDFGNPTANSAPVQRTFTVLNDGQSPLALSNLFVPAGYSLIEGLAGTLTPGQSDTFTVQLNTTTGGTWNGRLSFHTSDTATPLFDFPVTGHIPQFVDLFSGKSPALPNADGKTIIALDSNVYWTDAGGLATLPPLIIGGVTMNFVHLKAVSPDGTVLGGQVGLDNANPFGSYQAFIWSAATGYKLLDGPGANAQVMSISNNGLHASGIVYVSGT
ncbi:MAG TPA: choice-of-anchor D domain-containing protein, partial [Phycisphaerae bacterium]|nr:choice-of-anchor D domain-containing protein [Phycisphaerae bacterium]